MAEKSENFDETLQQIGARMKQIRKAKGFRSGEVFAFTHGLNRSSYGRFEAGTDIRMSSLLKVLKAFNMSLKDFFAEGFEETPQE